MRKINLLPAVIIISIFFLISCDGNIANDSSLPPLNYSHLITGIGGLQSHPDLTNETPWELHFDTTGENYDATFLGTLATGQYRIDISGLHWPDWPTADGLEISCLDSISLPLASNSVIFQTPLFNNKFELTDGQNETNHYITYIFNNGLNGPLVHICMISQSGTGEPDAWMRTRSFTQER